MASLVSFKARALPWIMIQAEMGQINGTYGKSPQGLNGKSLIDRFRVKTRLFQD